MWQNKLVIGALGAHGACKSFSNAISRLPPDIISTLAQISAKALNKVRISPNPVALRVLGAAKAGEPLAANESAPAPRMLVNLWKRRLNHAGGRIVKVKSSVVVGAGPKYARRSYSTSEPKPQPNSPANEAPKPTGKDPVKMNMEPGAREDVNSLPKVDHYGREMWQKLKSFPSSFRRFIGWHGPLTLDKVLPVFNLMFVGVGVGALVGTTTLISAAIWIVNRNDHWKELTAKRVGAYLTYQTGINIEYETMSASWSERRITLKNVKIHRDPETFPPGVSRNVTTLDLSIKRLTVNVSLMWLLQGNGILKHLSADGVTGIVDQSQLSWEGWVPVKRIWRRGDFFLDSFQLSNVNISLYQIAPARELKIQIHSIDCEKLRKQWLLYDILSAKSAYGIFDGSLFSLTRVLPTQKPQRSSYDDDEEDFETSMADPSQNIRSTLKIDGIKSDLLSTSSSGPISWITEGTIDIDMDLVFNDHFWEEGWHYHLDTNTQNGYYSRDSLHETPPLFLFVNLKMNNLRADIPMGTDQLTLIKKALVIPVVAYMNTNYTSIPLNFEVHVPKEQFNGSWSPWEAGLFDAISYGVAQEFLNLVKEQQTSTNIQRHLFTVVRSLHRGVYFLAQQLKGYYSLWYFNNDDHPEDLYAL